MLLQGKIRRVIDSVSGILGSSWIPGFLRSEDESEEEDQVHNQRDKDIEAKPTSSRYVPNRIIYPEEGKLFFLF